MDEQPPHIISPLQEEQSVLENEHVKTIAIVLIVASFIAVVSMLAGPFHYFKQNDSQGLGSANEASKIVVVENTPMVNGSLPLPKGFPTDIPFETATIVDSSTTHYPRENTEQLSASYQAKKTVAEKYIEYKNYMIARGYQVREDNTKAQIKALFGTKADADLSVNISNANNSTLVQISYLLKSAE